MDNDRTRPLRRSEAASNDSWIDISTQSSEIQRAPNQPLPHLFARASRPVQAIVVADRHNAIDSSSQDEYDESESESDRILSSSNEDVTADQHKESDLSEAASETENEQIVGQRAAWERERLSHDSHFVPQPNAFTQPSSAGPTLSIPLRSQRRPSYHGATSAEATRARLPSYRDHSSNFAHQADHDAVLRASLTTLLSCAAAARSLPKKDGSSVVTSDTHYSHVASRRVEPATLQIVREPNALKNAAKLSLAGGDKDNARQSSKDRTTAKRAKAVGTEDLVSPTLLTWAVSAGVLFLVSSLSFYAGYNAGRATARPPAEMWQSSTIRDYGGGAARSSSGLRRRLLGDAASAVVSARA